MTTLADLLKNSDMGGYSPQQSEPVVSRRGSLWPVTEYADGSSEWDANSGLSGHLMRGLDNLTSGRGSFWGAGDAAAQGDWRGAGHYAGDVAANIGTDGIAIPKPYGALGMSGGGPIYMSSAAGARAAAYRQKQWDEAIRLIKSQPEKFVEGTPGWKLIDDLERIFYTQSLGGPVKGKPSAPATILPFKSE